MQSQRAASDRQFKGPIDCAKQIVRNKGIFGLWTGFTGSLAFRSNFLFMFGSFEVSGMLSFAKWIIKAIIIIIQALMRLFSQLNGTRFEVGVFAPRFGHVLRFSRR